MKKLKVLTIFGTRPEIIRLSRVIARLDEHCDHVLVHTGQNYDYELNQVFFEDLGIDYIDGGWPAVDPRDREFFARARDLKLQHAHLAAFGSVRFPRNAVENDPSLQAVLETGTPALPVRRELGSSRL